MAGDQQLETNGCCGLQCPQERRGGADNPTAAGQQAGGGDGGLSTCGSDSSGDSSTDSGSSDGLAGQSPFSGRGAGEPGGGQLGATQLLDANGMLLLRLDWQECWVENYLQHAFPGLACPKSHKSISSDAMRGKQRGSSRVGPACERYRSKNFAGGLCWCPALGA